MNGFCERLKSERLRAKLTQKEIAEKLHISVQTYNGYETKGYEPKFELLIKICRVLRVTPNYLLGWGTDSAEVWHLISNIESNIEEIKTVLKGN